MERWRNSRAILLALLTYPLLFGAAQAQSDDDANASKMPPGAAAKAYALKHGAPGSAEYTAALRRGIEEAYQQIKTPEGDFDTTRAIEINDAAARSRNDQQLLIDSDPRYVASLEEAAGNLIEPITLEDSSLMRVRMIGGSRIKDPTSFRDVTLAYEPPSVGFCSGVLIDSQTVLTAAHCLCGKPVDYVVFGLDMSSVQNGVARVVAQKSHPDVLCQGSGVSEMGQWRSLAGRDLGILRLARPISQALARPRPLAKPSVALDLFDKGNRHLVVVGFGHTEGGDTDYKSLAITGILSPDCSGAPGSIPDETRYGCKRGKEILAKDTRLIGPCPGDSGGGAYMLEQSPTDPSKKIATLVGIVSRSVLRSAVECGDGAIYTLLTAEHQTWIRKAIVELSSKKN